MDAWLISGIPGAGKSTVSRLLAQRYPKAVHVEGDELGGYNGRFIVSGMVGPTKERNEESTRQMNLVVRNQCLLARSYGAEGFVPVMDYVVIARDRLWQYRRALRSFAFHLVVLSPGKDAAVQRNAQRGRRTPVASFWAYLEDILKEELAGIGLWVDSAQMTAEQTVDHILAHKEEALLPAGPLRRLASPRRNSG
jgi:predicted kinase